MWQNNITSHELTQFVPLLDLVFFCSELQQLEQMQSKRLPQYQAFDQVMIIKIKGATSIALSTERGVEDFK
jgi:hypothetical protein